MRACVVVCLVALGCGFKSGASQTGDGGSTGSDGGGSDGQGSDGRGRDGSDGNAGPIAYREQITIQGAMLTGTHSDLPVWITLSGSEASAIAAHARTDGTDIFFTDGTNALDYELQRWDPNTPLLQAWVRLPSLVQGTDATIYVEYGDLALAPGANAKNVFKSSYVAVWHLDDSLVNNTIVDSIGMSPGTAIALGSAASKPAELGNGIAFDGTGNSMITFTNSIAGDTASVITAWIQQSTTTHTSTVAVVGTGAQDESRFLYGVAGAAGGTGSDVAAGQYTDDWYPAGPDIQSGTAWTHVAWHYAGSKVNHIYVNGVEIVGSPHDSTNVANTTGTPGYLGYAPEGTVAGDYGAMTGLSGMLDEVRIATGAGLARDPGWFATEYANQSSPSTFYMVGAEQSVQ